MNRRPDDWLSLLQRFWFPLGVVALILIAIPGLILFGLNVFGGEASLNEWLLQNFQLTYHIPFPWWLSLVLLLVPAAIILLYFLKLKRKPLSVPSTFLWKKSIEDLHVNALFQWLRQNLLLLLQLLAVACMIYAIMDFKLHGRTKEARYYILLVDNSASMGATDVAPSRLEWAKREALKEIDAATESDVGMVIKFNSSAEIVQSYTNNRGALRQAVQSIEQTQKPTRIEEALSLADSLANPTRSADDNSVKPADVTPGKERTYVSAEGVATAVHLYSDGRFPDLPDFPMGNIALEYHLAGKAGAESTNNLAVVTFNAVRDDQDPSKMQAFVRVANFRPQPVKAELELEVTVNGQIKGIQKKPLNLVARQVSKIQEQGKEEATVRDVPGETAVVLELSDINDRDITTLHVRLAGVKDDLPADDEAWLVVGVVRKARILLVGEANDILNAFFDDSATLDVANITRMKPTDLNTNLYRKAAQNGEFDLVIFDRCGPASEEDMPRSNTFFIGYAPPPWKASDMERIVNPQVKGWMHKHPVLRYLVALQEIGIAEAFKLKDLPTRTPRLMEIDQNVTVLFTLNRQLYNDLVMTFPILNAKSEWNTNWPLLPSFPLFLRNVIYTYGNISDGASEEALQAGQVKTIRPDAAVSTVEITDPSGNSQRIERGSRTEFTYGQTDRLGLYRVGWGDRKWQRSFAVNLLDIDESAIEPRPSVQIGARAIEAGQETRQPRDLWKWLIVAVLGLLLLEWYVYNRRIFV
jgi:hypothetical protein